jgi:MFS family permease
MRRRSTCRLLLVADVAAGALGSLWLGALVDRCRKRRVMLAADLARAGVLGLLAWAAVAQRLSFWMLVVALAISGLLNVAFELARSAWVAQRIDAGHLPLRNAQISAGGSLAETAAFALGGWLYQWLGAAGALLVDSASYVVSALCLRGVVDAPAGAAPAPGVRELLRILATDARAGIAALVAVPTLTALASIELLVALGTSLAGTSYMIFVARDLGFATGVLGLIFATGGIGSVVGAALAPRIGWRLGRGGAMLLGLSLLTFGATCIPLAPGATLVGAGLLVAHQVIGDGGYTVHDVHDRTLRQTAVAPELLARVDAGIRTVRWGRGWRRCSAAAAVSPSSPRSAPTTCRNGSRARAARSRRTRRSRSSRSST